MKHILIDEAYCKGCELCLVVCKTQALGVGAARNAKGYRLPAYNGDACVACGSCEWICPELAITVLGKARKGKEAISK